MNDITFTIKDFGCKVNQYESQLIRENLSGFGYIESGNGRDCDIAIINSCSVTENADTKVLKTVRHIKKYNPHAKIFITGCYATDKDDIDHLNSMPEIFMVIDNKNKAKLPLIVDSVFGMAPDNARLKDKVSGLDAHTRAFVKVQDGCDQKCTFCKIRYVRGPSISREKETVIDEIKHIVANGYKEVVITGICLGSWKGENGENFSHLLGSINSIDGDFRVRLSSIEPNHIDEELIEKITNSQKIARHLHIPLQNGSDRVLGLMRRPYNTRSFRAMINKIRQKMPVVGITMDVIAGFPGESKDDFNLTVNFLKEIKPSRLHVFRYSDREGTPSSEMRDKVPFCEAKRRVKELINLGEGLKCEFSRSFVGMEVEAIIEENNNDFSGYTTQYVRVISKKTDITRGKIVKAKAIEFNEASSALLIEV